MRLSKPKLFTTTQSFLWVVLIFVSIISIRLFVYYQDYREFIEKPFYYTYAKVIKSYQKTKGKRKYTVLKLSTKEHISFYTTTYPNQDLNNHILRLQIFPDANITFAGYIGTFYVKSTIKKKIPLPYSLKQKLISEVSSQHKDKSLQSFYNAIFFATSIEKNLRDKITKLGVNHLVALSGFHIGILWSIIYGILWLIYYPFQKRYFPYRYSLLDIGSISMVLLGVYLWFVDFPPSLVRSYAMVSIGWVVLLLGMELISFISLSTIILLLLTLFPYLLVSLSFWLSVAGVFYIFLILQYTKHLHHWYINLIFIPFGMFIFMLPITHAIFGTTSDYQLLSPLISLLFVPFYPIVILFHLFGLGRIFDTPLSILFALPTHSTENILDIWYIIYYIIVSIGAIWSRLYFYLLFILAFEYGVYIFWF